MWIRDCLSSSNKVSSKRVVTFLAFILMGIGFLCDLFFDMSVSEYIYNSMTYIVMAGLGVTASEWMFTNMKNKSVNVTNEIDIDKKDRNYKKGYSVGYDEGYQIAQEEGLKGKDLDKESDLK